MGWTSHDVVAVVRRQLGTRSVGHIGTLDPFATGLLVVLVGKATRLARFLADRPKTYQAEVRLGIRTDTDDSTGRVTEEVTPATWPDRPGVERALASLVGAQEQRPPIYSAKHVDGERSHRLARQGEAVELPAVPVMVHRLRLDRWDPPVIGLTATVGSGTYLRALARDLGDRLGMPAHCATLRRTAIGDFEVGGAVPPEAAGKTPLLGVAELLRHLPGQVLTAAEAREIGFGRPVLQQEAHGGVGVLTGPGGGVVGIAEGREGRWQPIVVLEPAD